MEIRVVIIVIVISITLAQSATMRRVLLSSADTQETADIRLPPIYLNLIVVPVVQKMESDAGKVDNQAEMFSKLQERIPESSSRKPIINPDEFFESGSERFVETPAPGIIQPPKCTDSLLVYSPTLGKCVQQDPGSSPSNDRFGRIRQRGRRRHRKDPQFLEQPL